jgi:membrane protein YdbS with pleckstrin-like domain
MNKHSKKMVAPIIIVFFIIAYYSLVGVAFFFLKIPNTIRIGVLIISLVISIVMIFVLIERIKEIKKGEEDDLSKY